MTAYKNHAPSTAVQVYKYGFIRQWQVKFDMAKINFIMMFFLCIYVFSLRKLDIL